MDSKTILVAALVVGGLYMAYQQYQKRQKPLWTKMPATNIPVGGGVKDRVQVGSVQEAQDMCMALPQCKSFVLLPGDPSYAWFKSHGQHEAITVADPKTDTYFRVQ
jgi:hypothetical protein